MSFTYIANIVLTLVCVIMPFLKWLRMPVVAGMYSLFGMKENSASFSLFGYIFAGSNYQSDNVFWIMMLFALIALLGLIFLVIYAIKSAKLEKKRYKFGTIGTVLLNIVSLLFIVVFGLTSAVLKIYELTWVPYITIFITIANLVIIKKLKKADIVKEEM